MNFFSPNVISCQAKSNSKCEKDNLVPNVKRIIWRSMTIKT